MKLGGIKILVTGCAGFIGSSLVDQLLNLKFEVVGIDNFNNYYDPKIKEDNLKTANKNKHFKLYRCDILDFLSLSQIFRKEKPNRIIHLAARAGVRPSIHDPMLYASVNVLGTCNLLKLSVDYKVDQFIFGSSSSVYGNSPNLPFGENDPCDDIISPYGASKRAAEILVESFFRTYKLKSVILRFFSVYGPRGRPDMAVALFCDAIKSSRTIIQYGDGSSSRDYTYIDDVIGGIIKTLGKDFYFEIINLGNNNSIKLSDLIRAIELVSNKKAKIKKMNIAKGDTDITWAAIEKAKDLLDWKPEIPLETGLKRYWAWLHKKDGKSIRNNY